MKKARRKSCQRERIFQVIKESGDHPTALQVYESLRREMPSLSLGNVYRNIAILLEEGRIQGGEFGSGTVRYDAVTRSHYHFVCERCGSVSDFAMPPQEEITEAARRLSPHRISGHTIRFFGVCAGCAAKKGSIQP
ncbi:MAG: transcriptional repressor [Candidatus Aminicenantes bacterium]|nr:transcriptional repressor [Candidatus Aminicenantes bacterium]